MYIAINSPVVAVLILLRFGRKAWGQKKLLRNIGKVKDKDSTPVPPRKGNGFSI